MRWLVVVLAGCGGKSAPTPIANTIPPPTTSSICEDTIVPSSPSGEIGLVIDEETFLERAIREHEPELRTCYVQRLAYKPYLGGKVVVDLVIGADGKATRIHTKGFDREIDHCLCEKLSALTFETLSGGEVKASYPFYFTPPR